MTTPLYKRSATESIADCRLPIADWKNQSIGNWKLEIGNTCGR
jgi:hypothetical protein